MKCEHCGGLVTWEKQKGHWYGHCNNHGDSKKCPGKTYIRQEKVEEQLVGILDKIAPKTPEMMDWIKDVILDDHKVKVTEREKQMSYLNQMLAQVRRRKDKVYEDKVDDQITPQFYKRKFEEYSQEEKNLEDALLKLNDQTDEYQQLGVAIHELAHNGLVIYQKADPDEKRLLMSQFFTNLIQDGHKIKPEYTLAAEYLANWMPKLNENYEPPKMASLKEKTPESSDVVSFGSGGWIRTSDPVITFCLKFP